LSRRLHACQCAAFTALSYMGGFLMPVGGDSSHSAQALYGKMDMSTGLNNAAFDLTAQASPVTTTSAASRPIKIGGYRDMDTSKGHGTSRQYGRAKSPTDHWWIPRGFGARVVLCSLAAIAVTACGAARTTNTGASSLLPQTIRTAKVLTIGSDITYPPMEYYVHGAPTGFDIQLGDALGKALGVKISWVNLTFDGLIPALAAGRFEAIMSGMTDTTAREATVTFVDYINVGNDILVGAGNPHHVASLTDLCGLSVAGETGTTVATSVAYVNAQYCHPKGLPPVSLQLYPGQPSVILALESGRADAYIVGATGAVGFDKSANNKLQIVHLKNFEVAPYGIAVPKSSTKLARALQTALNSLIKSGTYGTLLKRWGLASTALTRATIDGANGAIA